MTVRVIATDDESRRHEYVWFGPVELPLPVGARLPALAGGVVIAPILMWLGWVITPFFEPLVPGPAWLGFLAHATVTAAGGALAAVLIVRRVGANISPVTPLRHHRAVMRAEQSTPRPAGPDVTYEVTAPDLWAPTDVVTHRITSRINFDEKE